MTWKTHESHKTRMSMESTFDEICEICGLTDRDGGRALSQPCRVDYPKDLSLPEKLNGAVSRARELEAEKHFYDLNQPFFPLGFSVYYRNPGHWDVSARQCPGKASAWQAAHPTGSTSAQDGGTERAFRIRGEPGAVVVFDERWNPHRSRDDKPPTFKSVMGAMLWIMEELMQEPPND